MIKHGLMAMVLIIGITSCSTQESKSLCSAPAGVANTVDASRTVFGVAFGQPLTVPECPKYYSKGLDSIKYGYSKDACYQRVGNLAVCTPVQDGLATIEYPVLSLPYWTTNSVVVVRLVEGKVEWVRIGTNGIEGQDAAISSLTEKYGKPKTILNNSVQNRMGAKFESLNVTWVFKDLTVSLFGTTGMLNEGEAEITTKIGKIASQAAAEKFKQQMTPL